MEVSPEFSASVYQNEMTAGTKQVCSYDLQGCKSRAKWEYSIGPGLSHVGGSVRLYACAVHEVPIRKHAENIVRLVMKTMHDAKSGKGDVCSHPQP